MDLVVLDQVIDTTTPAGRLMFTWVDHGQSSSTTLGSRFDTRGHESFAQLNVGSAEVADPAY